MLTLIEVPEYLDRLHEEAGQCVAGLQRVFRRVGEDKSWPGDTDLMELCQDNLLFLDEGALKYHRDGRFIRFFGENDLVDLRDPSGSKGELIGDFNTEALLVSRKSWAEAMNADPPAREIWERLQTLNLQIAYGLCAAYARSEAEPSMGVHRFAGGEVIIAEGDPSDEVYVLVSGSAVVTVGGHEVGKVSSNEIFGEMSFLTGSPRGATVTAAQDCLVQSVGREEFSGLLMARPKLALNMAQTIATRLHEQNEKAASAG